MTTLTRYAAFLAVAALPALAATCTGNFTYNPAIPIPAPSAGTTVTVQITTPAGCAWSLTSQSPGVVSFGTASGVGSGTSQLTIAANPGNTRALNWTVIIGPTTFPQTIPQESAAMAFFPVTPCRLVDTRADQGKTGEFGPPSLLGYQTRDITVAGHCNVPLNAKAVSMNLTVVPSGPLDFLSAWPAGQPYPYVSNVNSIDGSVVANAAIVTLGAAGKLTFVAGAPTNLIVDINGYFDVPAATDLALYTITPCRAVDTRADQGKTGAFGPPALAGFSARNFSLTQSICGVPTTAQAFSTNVTVVPLAASLDFLSVWPEGRPYPNVSTLNSTAGRTIANAAIVPAGTPNQGITTVAGNPTEILIDVNGYFAPNGQPGALHYFSITPCRVVDTRAGSGKPAGFGPPSLAAGASRNFALQSGACAIPSTVKAYSLNVTVVPQAPLDFLSMWPAGTPYPYTSVLNSTAGLTIANAAIVPAGATLGAPVTVVAGNVTDLIIDINGYFAP